MGLWSKGLERAQSGDGFLEFIENQPNEVKYTAIDEEHNIFDITGNVEIKQSDLKNGELKFKINKLDGDLILFCREFKPSIIPAEITGEILFRNPRLGNYTKTTRYKIGDAVYYIKNNKIKHGRIFKILLSSFINDKGDIEENLSYFVGKEESTLNESDIFTSIENVKKHLEGNKDIPVSGKSGEKYTCRYAEGDKVWIMENNMPYLTEICRVTIIWHSNLYDVSSDENETMNIKIEYSVKSSKNGCVVIDERNIFFNKLDLINEI